jgi:acetylglutamate kinase
VVSQPQVLQQVMHQLAVWQEYCGHHLVVVHGGGIYCDEWSSVWQLPVKKHCGWRVTPAEHLPVISGALAGYAHTQVVAAARMAGFNPVGLIPSTGQTLNCRLHPHHSGLGRVASVTSGDPSLVVRLLGLGFTPIFHSLAIAEDGECLNANADDIAQALSDCLSASELILLSDVPGVLDRTGQVIEQICCRQLRQLIDSSSVSEGMVAKLNALVNLSWHSLQRVVITSGLQPECLLDRLSGRLPATQIVGELQKA